MKIGILSDTHGTIPFDFIDAVEGCDYLIHAGDFASENCYTDMKSLGIPMYMIRGNCDRGIYADYLSDTLSFRIDGLCFFLTHDQRNFPHMPDNTDIAIFGHTHHYVNYERMGKVYLNPGSAGDPRGEDASFVILETNPAKVASNSNLFKTKNGSFAITKHTIS